MRKLATFLVALCTTTALWAYDLMWDDMFYNFVYYNQDPATGQYADTALTVVFTPYDSPLRTRTSLVIPAEIDCWNGTFPVTEISSKAFNGYDYLKSITLPNTIKRIGYSAFQDCESLISINLPNSITEIGEYAFSGCKSLTSIVIPDSVTVISRCSFHGCSTLTSITLPQNIVNIDDDAFRKCTNLTSFVVPDSITTISRFYDCNSLSSVVWNAKSYTGSSPFTDYYPITSFVFGNHVEVIPKGLCYAMDKLISVTIPNSVTTIGSQAFNGCTSLQYVNIPSSVTTINSENEYSRFFDGVMNGKVCKFDANLISDDVRLFVNCKFDSMIIGASVTTLNAYAFIHTRSWKDREPYYGSNK